MRVRVRPRRRETDTDAVAQRPCFTVVSSGRDSGAEADKLNGDFSEQNQVAS